MKNFPIIRPHPRQCPVARVAPCAQGTVAHDHPNFGLGCDRALATCRDRFANVVNFRGFPHIPGNDFVLRYPQAGSALNGAVAFLGMLGLFIVSIPLWVVPPLWPVIPVVILAWVNQRLLRYDALAGKITLHSGTSTQSELIAEVPASMRAMPASLVIWNDDGGDLALKRISVKVVDYP